MKIGVVVSQFNQVITDRLLSGTEKGLREQGVDFEVYRVPGAFEISLMAEALARRGGLDGLVVLGVLIEGETDHYKAICRSVTEGVTRVMLDHRLPIAFEVLMVEEERLAYARSEEHPESNKGYWAAYSVVSMIKLLRAL